VKPGDRIALQLRNSPEHFFTSFGAWKTGATVIPVRWDLPDWEVQRLMEVMKPRYMFTESNRHVFEESKQLSAEPLADVIAPDAYGICSSGATGTPKIILRDQAAMWGREVGMAMPLIATGSVPSVIWGGATPRATPSTSNR